MHNASGTRSLYIAIELLCSRRTTRANCSLVFAKEMLMLQPHMRIKDWIFACTNALGSPQDMDLHKTVINGGIFLSSVDEKDDFQNQW